MSNMLRKLRIAFSTVCAIAGLLLIGMWVRSYWCADEIEGNLSQMTRFMINSSCGAVELYLKPNDTKSVSISVTSTAIEDLKGLILYQRSELTKSGFKVEIFGSGRRVSICPYWFLVVLFTVFGTLPWIPASHRFSLRTLLIATTLVAMVLGAIALHSTRRTTQPPVDVGDFGSPDQER
jgi:hypothetical protein